MSLHIYIYNSSVGFSRATQGQRLVLHEAIALLFWLFAMDHCDSEDVSYLSLRSLEQVSFNDFSVFAYINSCLRSIMLPQTSYTVGMVLAANEQCLVFTRYKAWRSAQSLVLGHRKPESLFSCSQRPLNAVWQTSNGLWHPSNHSTIKA